MANGFEILENLSSRLTYKPHYSFFVVPIDNRFAQLCLRCLVLPDSSGSGYAGLTIRNTIDLDRIQTLNDGLVSFAKLVADFELHEATEFLKLDDEQIFLPHDWGDEMGGMQWTHFIDMSGRFLKALKNFIS